MATTAAWETVKQHSRQLSGGFRASLSPTKDIKFTKFQDSNAPITLNLDGNEFVFENHSWHHVGASGNYQMYGQQLQQLKDQNRNLQEENQLLKFKLEVLMEMLTSTKLDLVQSELELQRKKMMF